MGHEKLLTLVEVLLILFDRRERSHDAFRLGLISLSMKNCMPPELCSMGRN
jgi:hypothetical protein